MSKNRAKHLQLPATRRKCSSQQENVTYCSQKATFYLYVVPNRALAKKFIMRMRALIIVTRFGPTAIARATAMALGLEFDASWYEALRYREKEIALMSRLYTLTNNLPPDLKRFALRDYNKKALAGIFARIQKVYDAQADTRVATKLRIALAKL